MMMMVLMIAMTRNILFPNLLYIRHGSYSPSVGPDFNADEMEAIDNGDNNHNFYNNNCDDDYNNYRLARRQCEV